jgi:hypothetical protein
LIDAGDRFGWSGRASQDAHLPSAEKLVVQAGWLIAHGFQQHRFPVLLPAAIFSGLFG